MDCSPDEVIFVQGKQHRAQGKAQKNTAAVAMAATAH